VKFGQYHGPRYGYQIPVQYQIAFGFAAIGGCAVGGLLNGWIAPKFGFRSTFRVGMVMMICFTFPLFFAPDLKTLVIGEVLCGLPWGMFATLVPTYLAETCPLAFRPYMTAFVSICFATGQFIAAGVVQGLVGRTDEWGYRIPFALQWIWPPPLLLAAWLAPESPVSLLSAVLFIQSRKLTSIHSGGLFDKDVSKRPKRRHDDSNRRTPCQKLQSRLLH